MIEVRELTLQLATPTNPLANTTHAIVHDLEVCIRQCETVIEALDVSAPRYGTKEHRADVLRAVAGAVGVLQGVMGVVGPVVSGDMLAMKMESLLIEARTSPPILTLEHQEDPNAQ